MLIYFENQYLKYLITEKTKERDEFSSEWDQTDKILYGVILKEFDRSESELLRNNFVGLPKNNIFETLFKENSDYQNTSSLEK